MNELNSPQAESLEAVDRLLSKFMKAEMPNPWPKPPDVHPMLISPSTAFGPTGQSSLRGSRYSLALSVALIIGGFWLLSSLITNEPNRKAVGDLGGGSASTRHLNKAVKTNPPVPEKKNP